MPYSDLSDAWNSYDPRYLRVTDQGDEPNWQRMNEQEGELIPDKSNTRYYDQHWLAPGQELGSFGRTTLHPNALSIYRGLTRPEQPPAGDEVISAPRQPFVNTMPRVNRDVAFGAPWDDPGNQNAMMGRWDFDRGAMKISDVRGAAPSPDDPQIQGPTRPGYNHPSTLARVYGDIQRDLRLNPDQALGFLSNLNAESFGFAKPQEEGPQIRGRNTGGLGWGQWTANRRAAFEDYLRQTGTTPTSYEGNYGFLTTELQDPKWQPFLDNLRRQRDAESSTRYTERGYENPSRKTGRQDWLARTRRELPASQNALSQEVQGAAPPAPQDTVIGPTSLLRRTQTPDWLSSATDAVSSIPTDLGLPPRDEYQPDPDRRYVNEEDIQQGRREDMGVFGTPRPAPAGDVVLHPEREIPNINMNYNIGTDSGERLINTLRQDFARDTIADEHGLKSWIRNPKYEQSDLFHGLRQQLEPNYLRRMSYGSAPLANSLEDARPYRPLPPNYLRRQPFATGSSQL